MKAIKTEDPEISPEHFIAEHFFVYVAKGRMNLFDGSEHVALKSGECCIARKNRLGRFNKIKENNELEKIIIALDEKFLKTFQEEHKQTATKFNSANTFIKLKPNELLPHFFHSLKPYYNQGKIKEAFAVVKREELLIILLQSQPELAGLFFDYGIPEKINIEEFMNRNFKFNVRKRLEEAYYLISKKNEKPSNIYLDLGFEDLSHFSFAFKKLFWMTPTELAEKKKKSAVNTR
jgi:AraC family transcriptional regulator, exoenzyme S synthesis regulatory protein ExsA